MHGYLWTVAAFFSFYSLQQAGERLLITASMICVYESGRLQSLDWTGGLDWWTDTKKHFLTRLAHLWSYVELCSLLCNYTVVLEQIIY